MTETLSTENHINQKTDAELVAVAKRDSRAFGVLYERYYDRIFVFVYKRVETEELAADLSANVFLTAMTHLNKYEDRGFPFSSWLYRIAINEVNQFYRKNKRAIRVVSIDRTNVGYMTEEAGSKAELELALQGVEAVLSTLDEPSLALVEMRFFDQKSFKEIGEILGISEGNAKIKTYRVLEKLKMKLSPKS